MIIQFWETLIYDPILNLMVYLYHLFDDSMILAIVCLTLLLKFLTLPATINSFRLSKKQKELKPELDKLKEKYTDRQEFAQQQMKLYRENGVNPLGGCLPQLMTLVIFFTLYSVFRNLLSEELFDLQKINDVLYSFNYGLTNFQELNNQFLFFDLGERDSTFVLPVIAGVIQFILSKQMMKMSSFLGPTVKDTKEKTDDFVYNMQQQMVYILPIMNFIICSTVVSGLAFYIIISSLFSMVQYYLINRE